MKPARQTSPTSRALRSSTIADVVRRPIRIRAMIQTQRLDAGLAGAQQARRVRPVRDHDGNRGVELSGANRVDDRLKVRSASRDEDGEAAIHDVSSERSPSPATIRPITIAPDSPRLRQRRHHAVLIRRGADDDQPDAHVERAEHLVVGDSAARAQKIEERLALPRTLDRSARRIPPAARAAGSR